MHHARQLNLLMDQIRGLFYVYSKTFQLKLLVFYATL